MTVEETTNNNNKRIWIGVGAAALFCLCAVVAATFTFYKVGQRVQEGMKTDPESASQAAHAIVDYELPAGYQEQMSMACAACEADSGSVFIPSCTRCPT